MVKINPPFIIVSQRALLWNEEKVFFQGVSNSVSVLSMVLLQPLRSVVASINVTPHLRVKFQPLGLKREDRNEVKGDYRVTVEF